MAKLYRCPSCESVLNPVKEIVLTGRLGRQRTLFLFQPELGDYHFATAPGTDVVPGDTWEFHCPVCQHNITTQFSRSLAELNLEEGDGERRVVVFSKVANQHASFEVTRSGVQGFGEHKDVYFDAFVDDHYW